MEDSPNNSTSSAHAHLYKYKDNHNLTQEERRIKHLEEMKEKRHKEIDEKRCIGDEFLKQFDSELAEEIENMEVECSTQQKRRNVNFQLMLTEWFVDIPDDLQENWLAKLVPEGFRVLLITRNRSTCFYTNKGRLLFKIKTNFPGGGGVIPGITVLDCICNRATKTIFILDCLFWNSVQMLTNEASFRFFWLKHRFLEHPELTQFSYFRYRFMLIDCIPAEKTLIQEKMFETLKIDGKEILYDGVTFYHKESEYTFGLTPLASWLFSYMLPEKLGIDVPEVYSKKTPEGYVNLQHFIENKKKFTSMKKKLTQKKKKVQKKRLEKEKSESTDEMETKKKSESTDEVKTDKKKSEDTEKMET